MLMVRRSWMLVFALLAAVTPARAYIEVPHSFGQVVAQSSHIVLMRVEMVDREKNFIIYRKVKDIKGVHPQEVIKHNIGRGGLRPNEWKPTMDWAEPGKIACFFHNGGASETCIGNWWYQAYAGGEWWNHSHAEPFLLRSYCGPPEKLPALIGAMLEGKEVIVPCMRDGNKEELHNRTAKIQRMKASLKIQDFNQNRDFVGWGGEEFRRVLGMPGFTHISSLARTDPDARAVSIVDFDGDGKPDISLIGGGKVVILQNAGESLAEIMVPGVVGVRSAVWADYNADGVPDLLLATATGPKLFTNLGGGLRDDSHLLPQEPYWNLTAAAWLDYDGDGRPDILLANGYHGLRLYRNLGLPIPPMPSGPTWGKWHYLGPVDNSQGKGFTTEHPCEKQIDLKAEYKGKQDQKITWKQRDFTDGTPNNLLDIFPPQFRTWVGIYLTRTVEVASYTEVPISLGSDDTLSVWLDGKKILADGSYRGVAPDQNKVVLKLQPGKHDLLLKVCQGDGDFAFYFNWEKPSRPVPQGPGFLDVSKDVGFGPEGIGADVKGDSLTVADLDSDGRPDVFYGIKGGMTLLNKKSAMGVSFQKHEGVPAPPEPRVSPALSPHGLAVPAKGGVKLFRHAGGGKYTDDTARTGGLAHFKGWATSAAWGDVDNDGHLDLVVGCMKGPNRFFKGQGDGAFVDASEAIGLDQKIFNTQAVSLVDLNSDGYLDMIFNNEGQDSVVLLGSQNPAGKRVPLTLKVAAKHGVIGSQVRVLDAAGKVLGTHDISGGDGRGGQQSPFARFALEPGSYQVQVRLSSGEVRTRNVPVGPSPVRLTLDDAQKE
jgi:hypothetical protein